MSQVMLRLVKLVYLCYWCWLVYGGSTVPDNIVDRAKQIGNKVDGWDDGHLDVVIEVTPHPTYYPTYPTDPTVVTWSSATIPDYGWIDVAMDSSGTHMAATSTNRSSGCVYLSSNSGGSWTAASVPCDADNYYVVIMNSSGQYMITFSTGGSIYYSNDYGKEWTKSTAPGSLQSIVLSMSNDGQYVYFVNDETSDYVYLSTDYGASFEQLNSPKVIWTEVQVCGSTVYATSYYDSSIYKSTDNGDSWSLVTSSPNCWLGVICSQNNNGQTLFAETYYTEDDDFTRFYLSTDGGSSWSSVLTPASVILDGITGNDDLSIIGGIGLDKNHDDEFYYQTLEGVYLTQDLGVTWVLTSAPQYEGYGVLRFDGDGDTALLGASADGVLIGKLPGGSSSANALSSGAIASIVISVLFVVAAAATAAYFLFTGTRDKGNSEPLTAPASHQPRAAVSATIPAVQNPVYDPRTMSGQQHAASFNSEL
jgi:photosystem II stability/assembly factor-like uncharacterized protein